jgi:5-methylcytosine-specific restriction endonuclease McrA
MKICTLCKIEKHLSDFSPDKRISSGVQSRCKPCFAKIVKQNRLKNPQAHRDAVKRSTQKHYKLKLQRNNLYRSENPKKVAEWKKNDRQRNKHRIYADNAKRRVKLQGENSDEIKSLYALRDFFEGMSLGEKFHVDHIYPIAKGGAHSIDNLQVIPAIDNLRKGTQCN